jgi:hypothetical protein
LHVKEHVGLGLEGGGYGAVAEVFLNGLGCIPLVKNSAGVPEPVEADGARPNLHQQRFDAPMV